VDALSRPSATETPVNPVSILTGFSSPLMREWRGVKLSIKIVCSSVEGQRIDRLRQFDGLKAWVETARELWDRYGPFLPFPSERWEGRVTWVSIFIWCLLMRSSDLGVEVGKM